MVNKRVLIAEVLLQVGKQIGRLPPEFLKLISIEMLFLNAKQVNTSICSWPEYIALAVQHCSCFSQVFSSKQRAIIANGYDFMVSFLEHQLKGIRKPFTKIQPCLLGRVYREIREIGAM